MRARQTVLYDFHPESPRIMYEWKGGYFTYEQWQLILFMTRLEKKLDEFLARTEHA